jgi:Rieske Fe-S protein
LFKAKIQRQSGWTVSEEEDFVYILTDDGREYKALSNVCTHLGCRVRWNDEQKLFLCPCHDGAFNPDGTVSYGPPPRSLDIYEVKVENEQLYILGG